jgi:adenine-specific DNA methylase
MIERHFDIPFVANLALREKQIQQNYRPIIAVHKWFARRPGTLFRALLLSEFASPPLNTSFYKSNKLHGVRLADPFMGGGIPLIEANRLGCDVIGFDINPMSYWIVRQEIEHLNLVSYRHAATKLRKDLEDNIGHLYHTRCLKCGSTLADVKYFLWVKVQACCRCGQDIDLFPGHLVSEDRRHPKNVFLCQHCGELTEVVDRKKPGNCSSCSHSLTLQGPARRNHCICVHCGAGNRYPDASIGPPRHRMFAIEYYCSKCKKGHSGRFFKKPDDLDRAKFAEAEARVGDIQLLFVPEDEILPGVESDRLHRWGYGRYREMFNARQLLGLELSCRIIGGQSDQRIKNALATNLSDLLRYQNMLCRYDTMALKSLDIFSVHGFPVGLVQCESNLLGIINGDNGINVGSGGWSNIIEKYFKGKSYCDAPFEIKHQGVRKVQIPIRGEWIGDELNSGATSEKRVVELSCRNASEVEWTHESLDAVFTDPPYFGNVQYAELMDFCYVWLRRLVGDQSPAFARSSTRDYDELTGNINMGRGLEHFTEGLSAVFQRLARALKPGAPLAFTYHHNSLEAYLPVAVAILDAGLTCSGSLPCPAEMGASIHISGTRSSIIDTVFVCRSTGIVPHRWITDSPGGISQLVREDFENLQAGGVKPTQGDIRCIIFGQLIRLSIWYLRHGWNSSRPCSDRLQIVADWIAEFGGLEAVSYHLGSIWLEAAANQQIKVRESQEEYAKRDAEISF